MPSPPSSVTNYISRCQYVVENSSSPCALMLASSSLLKQVTENKLPLQLLIDIRNYLLNYLADRGSKLEPFVLGSLIQPFCRVTKFGRQADHRFREVVPDIWNFLSQVPWHPAIGLKILNQLASEMNERYNELSKQRLGCAILTFFQHFRKSYIGDQAVSCSKKLHARLLPILGIDDNLLLLNAIAEKIAINLKSEEVLSHTLSVFLKLASGYMTGKLLLKLDTVQLLISNHKGELFPFLDNYRCIRNRTTFYYTIGLLVFMEDSLLKFKSSMDHLMQPAGDQQRLSLCFDKLMADVPRDLDQKNRDKFNQKLTKFRSEFRARQTVASGFFL